MALLLSVLLSVLLCLALFTGFRWRSRSTSCVPAPETAESARPLEFYSPMKRLLAEQDFRYLASQPHVSAQVIGNLYRQRRQIFRQYLHKLDIDFSLITNSIRHLMLASDVSRADLAGVLVRSRAVFAFAMAMIQIRLILHACGFHGQLIDVGALIDSLATVQLELAQLTPVPALSFQN